MSSPVRSHVEVVVTATENCLSDLQPLVSRLKDKGLKVSEVMQNLGIISGKVAEADLLLLNSVAGVAAVEVGGTVQVSPPQSDLQ